MTSAPPRDAGSTRGVDCHCTHDSTSAAGAHGVVGLSCAQCGWRLEQTSLGEGDTGALHAHVRCTNCRAHGCLSTNMPGAKPVTRRGRALVGGADDA